MSKKLIVKHWQGFVTAEGMQTPGWAEVWLKAAKQAEERGEILAVFSVPKEGPLNKMADGAAVEHFERYLQGLKEGPPPGPGDRKE